LIAFYFYTNADGVRLARESLHTVLHSLKSLFRETEENKHITPAEIEAKAREIGRSVEPHTVWLGLYLIQSYFGVLGGTSGDLAQGQIQWVMISEGILKFKNIDNVWEARMDQEVNWLIQRDTPNRRFQEVDETDSVRATLVEQKQSGLLIFISHSSKDAEVALNLIELLKAALNLKDKQIRCTSVDGFKLAAGANTDDVLKAEVRQAQTFIGLLTPNSLASAYVLFELGARWGAGEHMVPVLAGLGPEALHGPLKGINCISASQMSQLYALLSDLAGALELELQPPAGYQRYAEKLVDQVLHTYPSSSIQPASRMRPFVEELKEKGERRLKTLTWDEVIETSKHFKWDKQLPKWTVVIEGTQFPVRPLAFKAAGLLPNDAATTHQAVAKLKQLGFKVFYENKPA
jgi:hypothetical protein